jgi:hypothetical protein
VYFAGQLYEYTFDDIGNLTSDGRWDDTWDVEKCLIQMATKSGVAGPKFDLMSRYVYMVTSDA